MYPIYAPLCVPSVSPLSEIGKETDETVGREDLTFASKVSMLMRLHFIWRILLFTWTVMLD